VKEWIKTNEKRKKRKEKRLRRREKDELMMIGWVPIIGKSKTVTR
jgi:hypothetical protein